MYPDLEENDLLSSQVKKSRVDEEFPEVITEVRSNIEECGTPI